MKALLTYIIMLTVSVLAAYSCTPKASAGVEINGVTWAVANIEKPQKFTSADFWPGIHQSYESCFVADNPCPKGWKIPGYTDFAKLTDAQSVSCEWVSAPASEELNGEEKCGLIFTDLATGEKLFLPAAGMMTASGECCDEDMCCFYWSTMPQPGELPAGIPLATNGGYFLHFNSDQPSKSINAQYQFASGATEHGYSVRCIKDFS